jgi:hypothetical protein
MPEKIINIDFLGKCYDVVEIDPLSLGHSSKTVSVIDVDASGDNGWTTGDGKWIVPKGVAHTSSTQLSYASQSAVISSSYEFQQEFKDSVGLDVGLDGAFEFSGSKSFRDIESVTASRTSSFVYSRAYSENHRLALDLYHETAPLRLLPAFRDSVGNLTADNLNWVEPYKAFVKHFGTHFTKQVSLGGMAFQRTSGSSKTYLRSRQTEDTLKGQAGVVIEEIKAGVSVEQARVEAAKTDVKLNLERTQLEFRGGIGNPAGIDHAWVVSCFDNPAPVQVILEPITTLLTDRFFPDDKSIDTKQAYLEVAIKSWLLESGTSNSVTAPLRFREPLAVQIPRSNGVIQTAVIMKGDARGDFIAFPTKDNKPIYEGRIPVEIYLESVDGSRTGSTIMAGDRVRIKSVTTNSTFNIGDASGTVFPELFVLHHGDDPHKPSRIGEYFLEDDKICFFTGQPGAPGLNARLFPTGAYVFVSQDRPQEFMLMRCDVSED